MKPEYIDHIGIAVKSIEQNLAFWQTLGMAPAKIHEVKEQKVKAAFLPLGNNAIELLEATSPDSYIHSFIEKRGEGIHHIALRVDDIDGILSKLKEKGVRLIDEKARIGAGGAKIAFLHPKAANGTLIELCERKIQEDQG